ncbi:MAG: hypothetical protein AAFX90_17410 [Pseudomonadota bacterium]
MKGQIVRLKSNSKTREYPCSISQTQQIIAATKDVQIAKGTVFFEQEASVASHRSRRSNSQKLGIVFDVSFLSTPIVDLNLSVGERLALQPQQTFARTGDVSSCGFQILINLPVTLDDKKCKISWLAIGLRAERERL